MSFCASPAVLFLYVVIRDSAMHPNTSLTGKHLVDFLLVITELYLQVLSLKRYKQIWIKSRHFYM